MMARLMKLGVYFALFSLFAYLWYAQYYQWIDCFNELGRCYDPDGSSMVYTTSGFVWAFPAAIFFALSAYQLYRHFLKK
jgi:hypothetical protein